MLAGGVTEVVFEIGVSGPALGRAANTNCTDEVVGKSTNASREPLPVAGFGHAAGFKGVHVHVAALKSVPAPIASSTRAPTTAAGPGLVIVIV